MEPNHYGQELAGWLVSGHFVHSAVVHSTAGGRAATTPGGGADCCVTEADGDRGDSRPSLEPRLFSQQGKQLRWMADGGAISHPADAMMDDLINL